MKTIKKGLSWLIFLAYLLGLRQFCSGGLIISQLFSLRATMHISSVALAFAVQGFLSYITLLLISLLFIQVLPEVHLYPYACALYCCIAYINIYLFTFRVKCNHLYLCAFSTDFFVLLSIFVCQEYCIVVALLHISIAFFSFGDNFPHLGSVF